MPEKNGNQILERLIYAATTAALLYFGGSQTVQRQEVKADAGACWESYGEFVVETMKHCTCEGE